MQMTLANKITVFRLILVPIILYLISVGRIIPSLALFLLALASDVLDGLVARGRKEITTTGQMLDPFADKVLFAAIFGYFTYVGRVPVPAFLALLLPQVLLIVGALVLYESGREIVAAKYWGKSSSFVLSLAAILMYLSLPYSIIVIYVGIGLSSIAALNYILIGLRNFYSPNPNKESTE